MKPPFISMDSCSPGGIPQLSCLNIVFQNIIIAALFFSGATLVVVIIIAGIRYMTSQGDAKQLETSKKTILYSLLGIVLVFFAFIIVNFVVSIVSPGAQNCVLGGVNSANCK